MFKKLIADKLLLKVLAIALISRVFVLACGYYSYNIVSSVMPNNLGQMEYIVPENKKTLDPTAIFGRFDVYYYKNIAASGYTPATDNILHKDWAFMPLYPLMIGLPQGLGIQNLSIMWGMFLSNSFYIIAMGVFAIWLRRIGKKDLVLPAVLLFSFFPGSVYFSAAYTESLFVLLTALLLLFLSKKKWLAATIIIGLAGITRKQGIFLVVPLLVELIRTKKNWRSTLVLSLIAFLPLAGFLGYIQMKTGSWLNVFEVQSLWSSIPIFPFSGFYQLIMKPQLNLIIQGMVWLAALLLLWKKRRSLDKGWIGYLIISLVLAVSAGEMASVIRYVGVLLPLSFLGAEVLKTHPIRFALILSIFTGGLALMTLLFVNGYGFAT